MNPFNGSVIDDTRRHICFFIFFVSTKLGINVSRYLVKFKNKSYMVILVLHQV